ncbi:MAG: glycolate oxidase subunit GlcF [Candidatus Binatia bacterium]
MTGTPNGSIGAPRGVANPDYLRECVHCGFCLSACPTYLELGTEMDSPRGRIHLVRALEDGTLALDGDVVRHLDLCLGCQACESACPSGVRYGRIFEQARAYVTRRAARPWHERVRRRALLAIFPYRRRLRALLALVGVARALGLWQVLARWMDAAALLPSECEPKPLAAYYPARGAETLRVALHSGCVTGELFSEVNAAAVRVLTRYGASVAVPPGQGCCGALHLHNGDPDTARALARRNIDAFTPEVDVIVTAAAGCGSTLKGYGHLLEDDPAYAERARRFGAAVRDVTEVIAAGTADPPPACAPQRVTYQDACHLAHAQGIRAQPRELLARVPGLELVELAESEVCCGSAGSYNLTEPEMARRLRERKIDRIAATGASCVAAANAGCALQIRAGLAARGLRVRVLHPIELLDEAYEQSPRGDRA